MKTFLPKDPGDNRPWYVIDAEGKPLGRLSVKIADMLRGKDKPTFSPQVDTGAFIVIINAEKVKLTGRKEDQKIYHDYSGFRGGLKEQKASEVRERHPDRLIKQAVKGMLPKNKLAVGMFSRMKVYTGSSHPHEAQKPEVIEVI